MERKQHITRRAFAAQTLAGAMGLKRAVAGPGRRPERRYLGVSCMTYVWSSAGVNVEAEIDTILGEIRAGGYDAVETFSSFVGSDERADRFAKRLDKHKLRLSAAYSGGAVHEQERGKKAVEQLSRVGRRLEKLGCGVLVFNPNPLQREKTDEELQVQADLLNELGRTLRESSVALTLHSHTPAFRSDAREYRYDLDHTDPALVQLNADVDWVFRGGADPYALLTRYVDRIGSCHLRSSVDKVWSETLGDGDIDYRRIAKIFERIPRPIWLTVELAYEKKTTRKGTVAQAIAESRTYVREVFGV